MIHTFVPFDLDRNLGGAYNSCMELIGENDWAVFLDHDAMFTTREWFRQITEAVAFQPDAMFVGMCNRIAAPWQQIGPKDNHDIAVHRAFGKERLKERTLLNITFTKGAGGVVQVVSKRGWRNAGGYLPGMFCVDHMMQFGHRKAGREVWMIDGLYLYHWRRAHGDSLVEEPKVKCECRGPEEYPTERISLP